ncbi:TPT1 [Mytilus edulis]|uniref:2'-phosphotransferase n=1 Tax=Mytilus edulis TaxID=6550 RepID=A0A8S3TLZ2_MYTED|nr:TPT1 [Mytilus edulis]
MSIININTCSFQELLQLPGIGIKTGEQIMDIREGKGFVTESDLATISHLRVTMALLSRLDFNQNGGGQNNGPPPEAQGRHNEMLSRVNTLIGGGHVASQGTPARVHAQSEFKQEAWHQGQSPGPWNGPSQMDSAFLECSPYSGDAGARPKTPGNWDGGYREQITKNEWSQPMMGDPNQSNPQHQGSSINAKQHWPGEASAWDKTVPTKRGAPSYPMGHTSNYAGQGSAPCTQPAHTGGGQYETPRSRYGKWQDNRGEDSRQGPAPTYEERPNNRGEDPRRTPARAYGDRQSQTQYNQGYTPVPPQGVTTGGSYEQHAYPMPHNEDRPRENIRGPDSRGGARATSGAVSKVSNAPKNIKDQNVGEVTLEYQGPKSVCQGNEVMPIQIQEAEGLLSVESEGEGTQDIESVNNPAPECPLEDKENASSDSEEEVIQDHGVDRHLSKTLIYVLRHGASKWGLKVLPGGFVYVDELLSRHPGLSGYTLKELTRLVEVDVDKRFTLERDQDHGWWKIKANQGHSIEVGSFGMPSVEENTVAHAYHYTTMLAWGDIEEEGLRRMNRQHIHLLSEVPPTFKPHWEVQIKIDVPRAQAEGYEFYWAPSRAILCSGNQAGVLPVKFFREVVHLDSGEQIKFGPLIVQSVLTQDQGDPGGEERGEIPGSLWFEREDTSLAAVAMASYGEPQGSWDSTEDHSPPRAVRTIDTDLENNEEAHNSGASSSEGEADTTLVDEENDCEIVTVYGQLRVGDEVIPMTMGKVGQAPRVANVTIRDKVTVPPNSVMKLSCQVNCEMPSYIVEAGSPSGLLVPRTLHAAGSQPVVCLINTSDKHVHVRQGELIAQAVEVEKIEVPAKVRVVGTGGYWPNRI